MPKKKGGKKGKGKKGKKGKGKKGAAGNALVAEEEMSKEELLDQILNVRAELEREREERNYFQLERDKINTFWEITKRQLNESKAEVRTKDRELEDAEEKHQNEIRVYKQKVKHLLYEHQSSISELKAENILVLKMAQDNHNLSELELRKDKRAMKAELKDRQIAYSDIMKSMQKKNDEFVSELIFKQKAQLKDSEGKFEKKIQVLRDQLELQRKTEVHDIEERKNLQIHSLLRNHEKSFSDIKIYYNDITLNNIALINTLKEQVEELKKKENRLTKDMKTLEMENKNLVDPLQKTQRKIMFFKIQLSNYEKDKELLKTTKARVKLLSDELESLKSDKEIFDQAFQKAQQERDELYDKFLGAVHEVQQKCNLKNILLEKKLLALADVLEKKEAQLSEVLAVSNLDPEAMKLVTNKLELWFLVLENLCKEMQKLMKVVANISILSTDNPQDVLDSKNNAIKDLQYELARVCKAHDALLHTCENRFHQFGACAETLGFKPLGKTARGPATDNVNAI